MSHPEIIENSKNIIIQYLFDAIGQTNIVSVILYGSVARNEESYRNVDGKLYLESDIDVLVVVKNRTVVIKSWLGLKRLSKNISDELRKKWVVSHINLSITTEERLLYTSPDAFHLHLKLNGKVIFGKELIELMPSYEYKDIPVPSLCHLILCYMMALVRTLAISGVIEGKKTTDGYNSVLRSLRKLTLFMIRAIIMKDGIPLNPYDLTDIRTNRRLYQIKNSAIFDDLLKSYEDIKLSDSIDSKEDCSIAELETHLRKVIEQFNLTIAILTGINYPFVTLPKKLIFGHVSFTQRIQHHTYILIANIQTGWSIGLFKFIIFTLFRPEKIQLRFYDLFISSVNLINPKDQHRSAVNQQRQAWLKLYNMNMHLWKYGVVVK